MKELYNTSNMILLKKLIAELAERYDYKTLITLPRGDQNVNIFDSRLLDDDIPQSEKRFAK